MKCTWTNLHERLYDKDAPIVDCQNEATHKEDCGYVMDSPVCADHKCRCSPTLEEAARRKAAKEARVLHAAQKQAAIDAVLSKARDLRHGKSRWDTFCAAVDALEALSK